MQLIKYYSIVSLMVLNIGALWFHISRIIYRRISK